MVIFSTVFLMYDQIILGSVKVALKWSQFRKQLLPQLTICSVCILSICCFSYFPFCIRFWLCQVPVHFLVFTFEKSNRKAMNRNWSNQKANPALKTKTGNKICKIKLKQNRNSFFGMNSFTLIHCVVFSLIPY